ncbi:MAG: SufD family Fe-S cluster assembly protein [Candidatus Thorarchaeota archaeon]
MSSKMKPMSMNIENITQKFINLEDYYKEDPKWLIKLRNSAWELFHKLPIEVDSNMLKFVQPGRIEKLPYNLQMNYDPSTPITTSTIQNVPYEAKLLQNSQNMSIIKNDENKISNYIHFGPLLKEIRDDPKKFEKIIPEAYALKQIDKLALLTLATFTWGSYLDIKPNTSLEKPIIMVFADINTNKSHPMPSVNFINIGENSQVTLLLEQQSNNSGVSYTNTVFNIGNGSFVKILSFSNHNKMHNAIESNLFHIYRDATINYMNALFGSNYTRTRNEFRIRGSGAEVKEIEIIRGQEKQFFDIFSAIRHEAPHTQGQTYARGVLSDQSTAIFKGLVDIPLNIPKCSSYLSLHGLLMDKTARFHTIPAMEISNSDVKAAHAATVSQIDQEKIFYFESRGISKELARKLISEGYVQPGIQEFSDQSLQRYILSLIGKHWYGIATNPIQENSSEWENELRKSYEEET